VEVVSFGTAIMFLVFLVRSVLADLKIMRLHERVRALEASSRSE
jgi:hypothetical protein